MTKLKHALPEEVRRRLADTDDVLVEAQLVGRRSDRIVDLRNRPIHEFRRNEDGTVALSGYATTWDTWYDVAGGAPYGWTESIARGAATRSLAERDDVRFLFDHTGIPMGRNKSGTMSLTSDDMGLLVELDNLDVQRNAFAAALASAMERGDVDEMSFAFSAVRQEWNDDYTERTITELRLFDVSAVTFPANPATIVGLRTADTIDVGETRHEAGFPLELARQIASTI